MPIFMNINDRKQPDIGVLWLKNSYTAGVSAGRPCCRYITTAGTATSGLEAYIPTTGGDGLANNLAALVGVWEKSVESGQFGPVRCYGKVRAYVSGALNAGDVLMVSADDNAFVAATSAGVLAGRGLAVLLEPNTGGVALKSVILRMNS